MGVHSNVEYAKGVNVRHTLVRGREGEARARKPPRRRRRENSEKLSRPTGRYREIGRRCFFFFHPGSRRRRRASSLRRPETRRRYFYSAPIRCTRSATGTTVAAFEIERVAEKAARRPKLEMTAARPTRKRVLFFSRKNFRKSWTYFFRSRRKLAPFFLVRGSRNFLLRMVHTRTENTHIYTPTRPRSESESTREFTRTTTPSQQLKRRSRLNHVRIQVETFGCANRKLQNSKVPYKRGGGRVKNGPKNGYVRPAEYTKSVEHSRAAEEAFRF